MQVFVVKFPFLYHSMSQQFGEAPDVLFIPFLCWIWAMIKEVKIDLARFVKFMYDKIVCYIVLRCAFIFLCFMYVCEIYCLFLKISKILYVYRNLKLYYLL